MKKRPGVMLYFDLIEALQPLSYEEKGILFDAILAYASGGNVPELRGSTKLVWGFVRQRIDKDAEAYDKQVVQRKYAVYVRECKKNGTTPLEKSAWLAFGCDSPVMGCDSPVMGCDSPVMGCDADEHPTTTTTTTTTPTTTTTTTTTTNAQAQGDDRRRRGKVAEYYLANVNANASEECRKELLQYELALGADAAIFAIQTAQDANKTNWNYIRAILEAYRKEGIASLEAAKAKESAHRAAKNVPRGAGNARQQFQQHGESLSPLGLRAVQRAMAEAEQFEQEGG